MKFGFKYILTLAALVATLSAGAQVTVEQRVDSVGIFIGQQAHLSLTVTMPANAQAVWPDLKPRQYVVPGIEIVDIADADTLEKDAKQVKIRKDYTITSFDEQLYSIPPLNITVGGKQYHGGTAALKVITVDVDTLHPNQIYPPKDVQDNPFLWPEWRPLLWVSLIVLLLCLAGAWLYLRLKQNKPIITRIRIVKHIPPHQRALSSIQKIKEDGMQDSGDQKAYYTRLTDTLRKYIEERFGFNAMEMTSQEIIEHLRAAGDNEMIDELRQLFTTADLVKFAKHSTLVSENDLNLVNAINYIDTTKLEGQPTEERIVPKLSEDDKRKRQNRLAIEVLLLVLGFASVAMVAYIAFKIWLMID